MENKKIKYVAVITTENIIYNKLEIMAVVENINGNFYDFSQIALDIELVSPKKEKMVFPGFYYLPYDFKDTGEITHPKSEGASWRFRIMPTETGCWNYTIILKENGTTTDTEKGSFIVGDNLDKRGVIGVEAKIGRNFVFQNGELYIPIGQNLAWSWPVKSREKCARYVNNILRKAGPYGMNYVRLWLASWCFSIQDKNYAPNDFTASQYTTAQLDRVFDELKVNDVYTSLVLFTQGMFSRTVNPVWHDNPYNSNNPYGYLKEPSEFFTNERAKQDARCYIRYVIARYGYSRNVMTWELFNEADGTEGDMEAKTVWHKEMTEYIRSVDPYNHMVTTSGAYADCPIARNDFFDFTYIHWYDYKRFREILDFYKPDWKSRKRPSFYGEIGLTFARPSIDDYFPFHHTNWLGIMGGMAATGMSWYWEAIENSDAYSDYGPLSEFAKKIPWLADDFKTVQTEDLAVNNPQVEIFGYAGEKYAYLWMYDDNYRYENKILTEFSEVEFTVALESGNYIARWTSTYTGETVTEEKCISNNGKCLVKTPAWKRDLAVIITEN